MTITISNETCRICNTVKKVYKIDNITIICLNCFGKMSNFITQMERCFITKLKYYCD